MNLYCIYLDDVLYGCLNSFEDVISFLEEWDFGIADVSIQYREVEFK